MSFDANTAANTSYLQFYWRTIASQIQEENVSGLKLVVGPTGLGKTSAIPDVIAELRREKPEQRCVYTSYRHLLIEEMGNSLRVASIPFVYLRRDEEVVRFAVQDVTFDQFLNHLSTVGFFPQTGSSLQTVQKLVDEIRQHILLLDQLTDQKLGPVRKEFGQQLGLRCSQLLNVFKTGLGKLAFKALTQEDDQLGNLHTQLCNHPMIWRLFPYIQFRYDPDRPILLVTVQKLLHGFFDGNKIERVLSLENNIIFLDEFDALESDVLNFLCRSAEIQNSFEFVRLFYEEMSDQQRLGNLVINADEPIKLQEAKNRAIKFIEGLEQECQDEGFSFPQIQRFLLPEREWDKDQNLSVFQSGVQILSHPFYLQETNKIAWEVVRRSGPDTLKARRLFQIIFRATERILDFFSGLWADQLMPEWNNWIEQCYDRKNDYVPGEYKRIISDYGQYKKPVKIAKGQGLNEAVRQSIYYKGYHFFRLARGQYVTAPGEVKLEQKSLTVSPEYILWRLCQSNLVFALSATGDIKRYLNTFDLDWLEQNAKYLPIDDEDKALVAALKAKKESHRNYEVCLSVAEPLKSPSLTRMLANLEPDYRFFSDGDEQPTSVTVDHRQQMLGVFLESLRWVTQQSHNQAHLLFMNSFRFAEKLLQKPKNVSPYFYDYISDELTIEPVAEGGREYLVTIEGNQCQVIFLDARKGREMKDEPFIARYPEVPLVVVTTFNTASNGVNLSWQNGVAFAFQKRDFASIHLLETHHFYFSPKDAQNGSDIDQVKLFIWQIWKLFWAHQISEQQFKQALRGLDIRATNLEYKKTTDYLLNQIALLYQALGRVDRQWLPMPEMEVRLAPDVVEIFEQYLTADGVIAANRRVRQSYTSTLILRIQDAIQKNYIRKRVYNELGREKLEEKNQRSRNVVRRLLVLSQQVRDGVHTAEDARKIMDLWWRIREAVLKQDYQFKDKILIADERVEIDFQRDFVHATAFIQPEHRILVNEEGDIVPHPAGDTRQIDLNWPYRQIDQNPVINWFFQGHNYKLAYQPCNQNYLFTPYVMQAILAGAIGEATLKALMTNRFNLQIEREVDIPSALFEVFDFKLAGLPVYIDAKNFSWYTLHRFAAQPGDAEYDEFHNAATFLLAAQRKWRYIVEQTGDPAARLVFVNLLASGDRPNEGWDGELNKITPYNYQSSVISLIQGALQADNLAEARQEFVSWINAVKATITEE